MKNFKNATLFTPNFTFQPNSTFSIENGKFKNINAPASPDAIDLHNLKIIPGLIDIHTHGNSNEDFSDGNLDGLKKMCKYYAKNGITSFCPTSLTLPFEDLEKAYKNANYLKKNHEKNFSKIIGIDMEGPYFNPLKKGAQNPKYIKNPDYEEFLKLYNNTENIIKIVCIAPELPNSINFIQNIKKNLPNIIISIAHTNCDYEQAKNAINFGANEITHLFNAMNGIHHRSPGPIIAGYENKNVFAQIITDGHHVSPPMINFAFNLYGSERMIIISDSLRCCGCEEGEYDIGGQVCILKNGEARLKIDGNIAGSCTNCFECMKRCIKFGVKMEDAIRAATYNPAKHLGVDNEIGQIKDGLWADFVVMDDNMNLKNVFINGEEVC